MTTRKGAIWHAAAIERARAACLSALCRSEEARVCLDKALGVAKSQGLLYEEMLIRRDRSRLAEPGLEADEELREAERIAQLLGIAYSLTQYVL
jgi:hypothetical protein